MTTKVKATDWQGETVEFRLLKREMQGKRYSATKEEWRKVLGKRRGYHAEYWFNAKFSTYRRRYRYSASWSQERTGGIRFGCMRFGPEEAGKVREWARD